MMFRLVLLSIGQVFTGFDVKLMLYSMIILNYHTVLVSKMTILNKVSNSNNIFKYIYVFIM